MLWKTHQYGLVCLVISPRHDVTRSPFAVDALKRRISFTEGCSRTHGWGMWTLFGSLGTVRVSPTRGRGCRTVSIVFGKEASARRGLGVLLAALESPRLSLATKDCSSLGMLWKTHQLPREVGVRECAARLGVDLCGKWLVTRGAFGPLERRGKP